MKINNLLSMAAIAAILGFAPAVRMTSIPARFYQSCDPFKGKGYTSYGGRGRFAKPRRTASRKSVIRFWQILQEQTK